MKSEAFSLHQSHTKEPSVWGWHLVRSDLVCHLFTPANKEQCTFQRSLLTCFMAAIAWARGTLCSGTLSSLFYPQVHLVCARKGLHTVHFRDRYECSLGDAWLWCLTMKSMIFFLPQSILKCIWPFYVLSFKTLGYGKIKCGIFSVWY